MVQSIQLAPVEPWDSGTPAIHGPDITGASAGKPFMYAMPVTGERPIAFDAENLPVGLRIDPHNGLITGTVGREGDYEVLLRAKNRHGSAEKALTIAIGRGLALTPPLGWNSWNAWRRWVDDPKVRAAADAMVRTGLAARGYTYVNIDSCWQGHRGGPHHAIQPNAKFPDMKALADYVHAKGLKIGIYSSPWTEPWGCSAEEATADWGGGALIGCSAGAPDPSHARDLYPPYPGKYVGVEKYESNDVAQWVEWGMDFLKYDWAPTEPRSLERMARPLKAASRDIILSICTTAKIEWADAYLKWAEMWRGIPDTVDTWNSVLINGFYSDDHAGAESWRPIVCPGKWNDLDMTALGPQFATSTTTQPNRLTQAEQVTHMTLWALYPSPLILSCALESITDFELRLFANEEVLAVNQDRLGRAAVRVREQRTQRLGPDSPLQHQRIQARPLADGGIAVGVFNLGDADDSVPLLAADLGMDRSFAARDLWERRNLGTFTDQLLVDVPAHGARMLKARTA